MNTGETFLFDKIIIGPLKSRRLGLSLGINLLPVQSKLCNFNCIYCECGWNTKQRMSGGRFHPQNEIRKYLKEAILHLKSNNIYPDALTFAGNGEPTLHPQFAGIMDDTLKLRNDHLPNAKVAVLTNASMLNRNDIVKALWKADLRILKLDAGLEETFNLVNQPARRSLNWIADHLMYFKGDLIIQSIFVRGNHKGVFFDNTSEENVSAWLDLLKRIQPAQVMIYSIDRATAESGLEKIPEKILHEIGIKVNGLGISTMIC